MESQHPQTDLQPVACEQIFGVKLNSSLDGADTGELWPLGAVLAKGETGWERQCCRELGDKASLVPHVWVYS